MMDPYKIRRIHDETHWDDQDEDTADAFMSAFYDDENLLAAALPDSLLSMVLAQEEQDAPEPGVEQFTVNYDPVYILPISVTSLTHPVTIHRNGFYESQTKDGKWYVMMRRPEWALNPDGTWDYKYSKGGFETPQEAYEAVLASPWQNPEMMKGETSAYLSELHEAYRVYQSFNDERELLPVLSSEPLAGQFRSKGSK